MNVRHAVPDVYHVTSQPTKDKWYGKQTYHIIVSSKH